MEKHLLHSGDLQYEDLYGTVSATLLLMTNDKTAFMFERIYNHNHEREPNQRDRDIA